MKKFWLITLTLIMALALCFGLTACGGKTVEQLQNELGALLEGGNFEEGSVLNLNDVTEEKVTEVLGKLEENGIAIDDATKTYIYDIFVSKDNTEAQPDGKVKVTVPMPADEKAALFKAVAGLGYHSVAEWLREKYRETLRAYIALNLENKTLHEAIPPTTEIKHTEVVE